MITVATKNNCFSSIDLFLANILILYPLKTLESQSFFGVPRVFKMETMTRDGLSCLVNLNIQNDKSEEVTPVHP